MKKQYFYILGLIILVIVGWAIFRPDQLFVSNKVDEAMPIAASTTVPVTTASGNPAASSISNSASPVANNTKLSTGSFASLAHQSSGTASIYHIDANKTILRLENFSTSSGPDVHVYLVASATGNDDSAIKAGKFLDLGSIKGNQGNQNYDIPAGTDLSLYHGVSIWCARFSVAFAAADLK